MSPNRKPWLFLKRVNTWNPLSGVKHLMEPPAAPKQGSIEPSPEKR